MSCANRHTSSYGDEEWVNLLVAQSSVSNASVTTARRIDRFRIVRPTEQITNMVSRGHITRHGAISSVLELPSSLDFPSLRIFPTVRAPPFSIPSTHPLHLDSVLPSIDRCVRSPAHLGLEPTRHGARVHRRVRLQANVVERMADGPSIRPYGCAGEVKTNENNGTIHDRKDGFCRRMEGSTTSRFIYNVD